MRLERFGEHRCAQQLDGDDAQAHLRTRWGGQRAHGTCQGERERREGREREKVGTEAAAQRESWRERGSVKGRSDVWTPAEVTTAPFMVMRSMGA
jgi:hypothetical protein